MREIYDQPELLEQMAAAAMAKDWSLHRKLQKSSGVRRSDQGKGAKEADLVIPNSPCWFELQTGSPAYYSPIGKLEQAEKDVAESGSDLWPVSICHKIATPLKSIIACMRFSTLMALQDLGFPDDEPSWLGPIVVQISLVDLIKLLKARLV